MKSAIERNKELARCGRGVLSLTEEEQRRIKEILRRREEGSGFSLELETLQHLQTINNKLMEITGGQRYYCLPTNVREREARLRQLNAHLSSINTGKKQDTKTGDLSEPSAASEASISSEQSETTKSNADYEQEFEQKTSQ